ERAEDALALTHRGEPDQAEHDEYDILRAQTEIFSLKYEAGQLNKEFDRSVARLRELLNIDPHTPIEFPHPSQLTDEFIQQSISNSQFLKGADYRLVKLLKDLRVARLKEATAGNPWYRWRLSTGYEFVDDNSFFGGEFAVTVIDFGYTRISREVAAHDSEIKALLLKWAQWNKSGEKYLQEKLAGREGLLTGELSQLNQDLADAKDHLDQTYWALRLGDATIDQFISALRTLTEVDQRWKNRRKEYIELLVSAERDDSGEAYPFSEAPKAPVSFQETLQFALGHYGMLVANERVEQAIAKMNLQDHGNWLQLIAFLRFGFLDDQGLGFQTAQVISGGAGVGLQYHYDNRRGLLTEAELHNVIREDANAQLTRNGYIEATLKLFINYAALQESFGFAQERMRLARQNLSEAGRHFQAFLDANEKVKLRELNENGQLRLQIEHEKRTHDITIDLAGHVVSENKANYEVLHNERRGAYRIFLRSSPDAVPVLLTEIKYDVNARRDIREKELRLAISRQQLIEIEDRLERAGVAVKIIAGLPLDTELKLHLPNSASVFDADFIPKLLGETPLLREYVAEAESTATGQRVAETMLRVKAENEGRLTADFLLGIGASFGSGGDTSFGVLSRLTIQPLPRNASGALREFHEALSGYVGALQSLELRRNVTPFELDQEREKLHGLLEELKIVSERLMQAEASVGRGVTPRNRANTLLIDQQDIILSILDQIPKVAERELQMLVLDVGEPQLLDGPKKTENLSYDQLLSRIESSSAVTSARYKVEAARQELSELEGFGNQLLPISLSLSADAFVRSITLSGGWSPEAIAEMKAAYYRLQQASLELDRVQFVARLQLRRAVSDWVKAKDKLERFSQTIGDDKREAFLERVRFWADSGRKPPADHLVLSSLDITQRQLLDDLVMELHSTQVQIRQLTDIPLGPTLELNLTDPARAIEEGPKAYEPELLASEYNRFWEDETYQAIQLLHAATRNEELNALLQERARIRLRQIQISTGGGVVQENGESSEVDGELVLRLRLYEQKRYRDFRINDLQQAVLEWSRAQGDRNLEHEAERIFREMYHAVEIERIAKLAADHRYQLWRQAQERYNEQKIISLDEVKTHEENYFRALTDYLNARQDRVLLQGLIQEYVNVFWFSGTGDDTADIPDDIRAAMDADLTHEDLTTLRRFGALEAMTERDHEALHQSLEEQKWKLLRTVDDAVTQVVEAYEEFGQDHPEKVDQEIAKWRAIVAGETKNNHQHYDLEDYKAEVQRLMRASKLAPAAAQEIAQKLIEIAQGRVTAALDALAFKNIEKAEREKAEQTERVLGNGPKKDVIHDVLDFAIGGPIDLTVGTVSRLLTQDSKIPEGVYDYEFARMRHPIPEQVHAELLRLLEEPSRSQLPPPLLQSQLERILLLLDAERVDSNDPFFQELQQILSQGELKVLQTFIDAARKADSLYWSGRTSAKEALLKAEREANQILRDSDEIPHVNLARQLNFQDLVRQVGTPGAEDGKLIEDARHRVKKARKEAEQRGDKKQAVELKNVERFLDTNEQALEQSYEDWKQAIKQRDESLTRVLNFYHKLHPALLAAVERQEQALRQAQKEAEEFVRQKRESAEALGDTRQAVKNLNANGERMEEQIAETSRQAHANDLEKRHLEGRREDRKTEIQELEGQKKELENRQVKVSEYFQAYLKNRLNEYEELKRDYKALVGDRSKYPAALLYQMDQQFTAMDRFQDKVRSLVLFLSEDPLEFPSAYSKYQELEFESHLAGLTAVLQLLRAPPEGKAGMTVEEIQTQLEEIPVTFELRNYLLLKLREIKAFYGIEGVDEAFDPAHPNLPKWTLARLVAFILISEESQDRSGPVFQELMQIVRNHPLFMSSRDVMARETRHQNENMTTANREKELEKSGRYVDQFVQTRVEQNKDRIREDSESRTEKQRQGEQLSFAKEARAAKNPVWYLAFEKSSGPEKIFVHTGEKPHEGILNFSEAFLDHLIRRTVQKDSDPETFHLKDARVAVIFDGNRILVTIHHAEKVLPESVTLTLEKEINVGEEQNLLIGTGGERLIFRISADKQNLIVYHPVLREPTELLTGHDWAVRIFMPYVRVWELDDPVTPAIEVLGRLWFRLMAENEDHVNAVIESTLGRNEILSDLWGAPLSGFLNIEEKGFLPRGVDLNRVGVHEFFARFVMALAEPGHRLEGKAPAALSQFEAQLLRNFIHLKPYFEEVREDQYLKDPIHINRADDFNDLVLWSAFVAITAESKQALGTMRQWEDLQQGLGEHFKTMTLQEAFDELMRDP
ncbi:MAG: TolC family protein, partial [Candidatus Omnitrophica bacterium]|nr:TolC family protein [Candidatus Omnitrophota bacterium]